jgi:hypothetical protein
MEILNLPPTSPSKGKTVDALPNVLSRLQQVGSIKARVASVTNGQALLLTRLGEITSSNALKLKPGDTVQIRLDGDKQNLVLKVTPTQDQVTLLAANNHLKLVALLPANLPTMATIVSHKGNNTLLQIGLEQISVPLQSQLKVGQLLNIIHHLASTKIEIKSVDHQQVLRSALAQLLSAHPQSSANHQKQPLLQLMQSMQKINTEQSTAATLTNNSHNFPSAISVNKGNVLPANTLPNNTISALISGLELLIRSLPTVSTLNQRAIRKMVELATQNTLGNKLEKGLSSSSPLSLLRQLPQTEQDLNQIIQTLLKANHKQAEPEIQQLKKTTSNNNDILMSQFRDAIRSTEQSLNQQLYQQTSLRFQQELQQPIAFNLNIPYMEQQTVKSLQLKIRQKSKEVSAENQAWEIRLSFKFGLLGLISSHILLDGDTLSTSFWAFEEATKNKINDALSDFKQQLVKSGFNLGHFFCYLGQPPQESDYAFSPIPESLLDIKV